MSARMWIFNFSGGQTSSTGVADFEFSEMQMSKCGC